MACIILDEASNGYLFWDFLAIPDVASLPPPLETYCQVFRPDGSALTSGRAWEIGDWFGVCYNHDSLNLILSFFTVACKIL
jgi:hypothetical protein